jgi:transposase
MIIDLSKANVYVFPGHTDMRKQISGLTSIVHDLTDFNIKEDNLFLFCGKNKKNLKILYWDMNGLCLWQKKLSKDKFPWPKTSDEVKEIDIDQFRLLLRGIDFWNEHKKISLKDLF